MKIQERHNLIRPAIGVHPREQESYDLATSLLYALPSVVVVSAIFDQLLVMVYMKWFHPWKDILKNTTDEGKMNDLNKELNIAAAMQETLPLTNMNENILQDGADNVDAGNSKVLSK